MAVQWESETWKGREPIWSINGIVTTVDKRGSILLGTLLPCKAHLKVVPPIRRGSRSISPLTLSITGGELLLKVVKFPVALVYPIQESGLLWPEEALRWRLTSACRKKQQD